MSLRMKSSCLAIASGIALALAVAGAAACQPAPLKPSASPEPSVTPTPLAACPATPAPLGPQVLLKNLPAPDDLAFGLDGRLLFTDINAGSLSALNADGSVDRLSTGLAAPEGIVPQGAHYGSGPILVAEQGRNRVLAIDPQSHVSTVWHVFPNRTGRDGIDGIGPELGNGDVVVPDSPNGVVWRLTADGKTATQIASGMARPVGAAVDANGRIFVADEGGALWILDPNKRRFATLPTPDDVLVARDGHIFVNTLGDNAIHEFDGQGHQLNVIRGIAQPQGIALDGADNLYYTEFNSGRIDRIVRTFSLDPPRVTKLGASTFAICPSIRRAAGFTQPLTLSTGSGSQTSILQRVQPGTASSGALEVKTTERSLTITVTAAGSIALSQAVDLPQ